MSDFHRIEIEGGPHAAHSSVKIDGVQPKGVTRLEMVFDVKDVIRAKVSQIAEARIDVEATVDYEGYTLHVVSPEIVDQKGSVREIRYALMTSGKGGTLAAALRDAAYQLDPVVPPAPIDAERIYQALKHIVASGYIDIGNSTSDLELTDVARDIVEALP